MQERKIRETIESIVDIINPPFRIRIGIRSFFIQVFQLFKDAWFLTTSKLSGLEESADDYRLIYVSDLFFSL